MITRNATRKRKQSFSLKLNDPKSLSLGLNKIQKIDKEKGLDFVQEIQYIDRELSEYDASNPHKKKSSSLTMESSFLRSRLKDNVDNYFIEEKKGLSLKKKLNGNVFGENLFFFDWDDTIFPTSWLMNEDVDISAEVKPSIKSVVSKLDCEAFKLLQDSIKLGRVLIVTAATRTWVLQGAKRLMPKCYKLINNCKLKLISARDQYQWKNIKNPVIWKLEAFDHQMRIYYRQNKNICYLKQVFCIGDSACEHEALSQAIIRMENEKDDKELNGKSKKIQRKSLKLQSLPSPENLLLQLQFLKINLNTIHNLENNFLKELTINEQQHFTFEELSEDVESFYDIQNELNGKTILEEEE